MLFSPNPGILAAGASTGKTYAEYVAHISALATGGAVDWDGVPSGGRIRATARAVSGVMYGSPWMNFYARGISSFGRIIQHCMPSQSVFNSVIASGTEVFLDDVSAWGSGDVGSVNRNGYQSMAYEGALRGLPERMIYWLDGRAWLMQPPPGLGPTPYDW